MEFKGVSVQSWMWLGELLYHHFFWSFWRKRSAWGCSKVVEKSWKSLSLLKRRGNPGSSQRGFPSWRQYNWIYMLWLDEIYVQPFSHVLVPLPAVIFQQPGIRGGSLPVKTLHHVHEWLHSPGDSGGRCQNASVDSYGSIERISMEWPNEHVATPDTHYEICTFSKMWVIGTSVNLFAYCKLCNDYCSLSQMDNDSI